MIKRMISIMLCVVMLTGIITVAGTSQASANNYGSYELHTIVVGESYHTGFAGVVSKNTSVVKVDSDGVVTGVGEGKAMVGMYSGTDFTNLYEFTVVKANVKLSQTKLSMTVGARKFIYLNDSFGKAGWKTSNSKVVAVSLGMLTAKKAGKATVSATYGGKTYKCAVTVKAGKTSLNYKKLSLTKGGTAVLKLNNASGKVKWKSSSKKKVSVNSKGEVTARKKGKATVTTKNGKKKYKCKITVSNPKTASVKFAQTVAVSKGGKVKLKLKGSYKWASSKKSVATVKKGTVTAKKAGSATITAKKGKKKYKCSLKVFAEKKASVKNLTDTNNTASFKNGVKVAVDPGLLRSGAQLSVAKVSGLPKLDGIKMKAFDINLKGAKVNSANVATITIPIKLGKKDIPIAAYFNEKKNRWERTICSYSKGKVTMLVNHFSPHAVGKATAANFGTLSDKTTQESVYAYWAAPEATVSGERALQIIKSAANASKPTKSCMSLGCEALEWLFDKLDWVFDKSTNFYANLTGALVPAHLQDAFSTYANNFGDHIGLIGFALATIKGIKYVWEGKTYEAAGSFMSGIHGLATAYLAKWFGTAGLSAGLFATACIGYALNKVYDSALAENEKRWYKVYTSYYQLGADGYLHMYQWRDKLLPILENTKLTDDERKNQIAAVVDAYVNEAWNSPWFAAYFYQATGAATTFGGGLSSSIQSKLSGQKKYEVYIKVLPVVLEWFSKKKATAAQEGALKSAEYLAEKLSRELTTKFYDGSRKSGKKSELSGWTVKWKKIPSVIKDKNKLKVKLDSMGQGDIDFTLFATLKYKFGNKVQVCNKKGKVIDTITIANQKIPKTSVNVMTKKVREYLDGQKIELNKTKLTLNKGKSFELKLKNAKASKIKWTSANKKIASVKKGKVTALKKGKTTITAKYKGKSYKCKVTVNTVFHGWKFVGKTEKNINYTNYKVSETDYFDQTPENPEPNTIYALGSYTYTALFNAVGSNGSFSVKHSVTTDEAWSKAHSGKCNEYFNAVAAADTPKKKYKAGERLSLKMKIIASHSSRICTGGIGGCTLYVKSSYVNPEMDSDGLPKYSNMTDSVSVRYGVSEKNSAEGVTEDTYAPSLNSGHAAKKGDTFYISVGVEKGRCHCYTLYKYQFV